MASTSEVMEVGPEVMPKRTSEELSSDSADSAPQSPIFKKPCTGSFSVPSSPA